MDDESKPHDDPRFVEILEACLHMEIAGHKESYKKIQGEIKRIKRNVLMKLERRKELKNKIEDAEDLISTLNVTLKKLQEHVRETEKRIALIETNADDRSKLRSYEMQRYRDILQEYKKTWESYHARYEEFPLAKKRKEAKINVERARIEEMVLKFQIKDMEKKIQQKKKIDYLRTKSKIVEFVKAMSTNEKLEKDFTKIMTEIDLCKQELRSMELEMKSLREQEEEEKKVRTMQLLEMPPPKINLSRMRLNYSRKYPQELQFRKQSLEIDNDSMSVNTITLEEMCIRDETSDKTSKKRKITEEPPSPSKQIDSERATSFTSQIEEKETHAIKNTKTYTETTPLQKETHAERELPFIDKAETIAKEKSFRERDMHKATTTDLREEKKYVVDHQSNKFPYNVQELDRMKKFMQSEKKSTGNMESELPDYSLKLANEKDIPVPRVLKIEKVQYDIGPLAKREKIFESSKSITSHNFEINENLADSLTLNDALMIKEINASRSVQPSIYDGNSMNFKYSECANVSTIADMDINMDSIDAECEKVDGKEDATPKVTPQKSTSTQSKKTKKSRYGRSSLPVKATRSDRHILSRSVDSTTIGARKTSVFFYKYDDSVRPSRRKTIENDRSLCEIKGVASIDKISHIRLRKGKSSSSEECVWNLLYYQNE